MPAPRSALWIAHVTITEPEAYHRYAALSLPAVAAYGGKFLARGGRYRQMEGTERERHVVARFPSLEEAVACYESEAYQAAVAHARGASVRDLVIVEELEG